MICKLRLCTSCALICGSMSQRVGMFGDFSNCPAASALGHHCDAREDQNRGDDRARVPILAQQ